MVEEVLIDFKNYFASIDLTSFQQLCHGLATKRT